MEPRFSRAEFDRLLREVERRLSRTLLDALSRVRQGVPITALERAILERNVAAAARAIVLEPLQNALAEIQRLLPAIREAGWDEAVQPLPKAIRGLPTLQLTLGALAQGRPDLLRVVAEQDLTRIRQVTQETRAAFEETLRSGIAQGKPPQQLAREILEALGLNRNQAQALKIFRQALGREEREPAQIDRMVARRSQQMLTLRARTVARSETMRALGEGRRLQWQRLSDEGTIAPSDWEREWVTASDERTCPICLALHGERVPIGGSFLSLDGPLSGPPAHVNCRCVDRLTLRGFRQGEAPAPARERILKRLGRLAVA